jgi:hypothetical protein
MAQQEAQLQAQLLQKAQQAKLAAKDIAAISSAQMQTDNQATRAAPASRTPR